MSFKQKVKWWTDIFPSRLPVSFHSNKVWCPLPQQVVHLWLQISPFPVSTMTAIVNCNDLGRELSPKIDHTKMSFKLQWLLVNCLNQTGNCHEVFAHYFGRMFDISLEPKLLPLMHILPHTPPTLWQRLMVHLNTHMKLQHTAGKSPSCLSYTGGGLLSQLKWLHANLMGDLISMEQATVCPLDYFISLAI